MSTLTVILLLVIWLLAAIIYGLVATLGSPRFGRGDYNLFERIFLAPFITVAWLLRSRK